MSFFRHNAAKFRDLAREQLISTNVLRSIPEPSTNDPRERHFNNNTRYFNVPNCNFGVNGSCARPCMRVRPSSLYGEKSFQMSAPFKRSPQCMRQPDGEAAYTTLSVSPNRMADKMLCRHLATSLKREAPATPSALRCGRAIIHTSAQDKRRMDLRPGANPEKTVDPHHINSLSNLVCWTCFVWGNIRKKTLH